ncbi:hypothetical protein D3C73_1507300 [compost metagenome]
MARSSALMVLRVPMTHAATWLMLPSKKSRPMFVRGSKSPRTSSRAISSSSSSIVTTWSLSQRTGLLTCSRSCSLNIRMEDNLFEITSVGWK